MKKYIYIVLSIIILTIIVATSLAIYKSTLNGSIETECAEVVAELITSEADSFTIDEDNLILEYDFTVNNYDVEEQVINRNQTICDYYIKVVGLVSNIFDVKLYSIDSNQAGTLLYKETEGEFLDYYITNQKLEIGQNISHDYKLVVEISVDDLINVEVNVEIDLGYRQDIEEPTHVNSPDLTTGLIPVVYDDINNVWVKTSSDNINWYDYQHQKWANAVTALNNYNDGVNSDLSYINAPDGTQISYSDITTMFVWVPRFVYRIDEAYYHKTIIDGSSTLAAPPVDIHFSKGENNGGDDWDENIIVVNSGTEAGDCKDSWTTHSAFQFGDTYLNGMWIAKFQAAIPDSTLYIQPAKIIKTKTRIDDAFRYCRNMEANSVYGWQTASTLQDDATFVTDNNGLDIHLVKNSEWSAFAFLTHSKYGQGKTNIANSLTSVYSGQNDTELAVFSGNGPKQSTTGNAYGIYDVSSTIWNWVAAYIDPGENNINSPRLVAALSKYKNVYTSTNYIDYSSKDAVYSIFEKIKDAAIWEVSTTGNVGTSAWFSGRSNIGFYANNKYSLLLLRGGAYTQNGNIIDSVFSFGYGEGSESSDTTRSFRPALVVHSDL